MVKTIASLEESALSGNVHSQISLLVKYGCGEDVEQDIFKAYAWLFVAKKSECEIEPIFERELWHRLKTDENRRNALVDGNELLKKVRNYRKKSLDKGSLIRKVKGLIRLKGVWKVCP